jgi:hypothetical protein
MTLKNTHATINKSRNTGRHSVRDMILTPLLVLCQNFPNLVGQQGHTITNGIMSAVF